MGKNLRVAAKTTPILVGCVLFFNAVPTVLAQAVYPSNQSLGQNSAANEIVFRPSRIDNNEPTQNDGLSNQLPSNRPLPPEPQTAPATGLLPSLPSGIRRQQPELQPQDPFARTNETENPLNNSVEQDVGVETEFRDDDLSRPLVDDPDIDIEPNEENTLTSGSTFGRSILPRREGLLRGIEARTLPLPRRQNGAINRQTIDGRPETTRIETSRVILRPYESLGKRIGSFILFADLNTDIEFSDNILAAPSPKLEDVKTIVQPRVRLVSNWLNHAVEALLVSEHGFYKEHNELDEHGYEATFRGALDITSRTRFLGEFTHQVDQESQLSSERIVTTSGTSDIETNRVTGEFQHRFNRLSLRLRGQLEQLDYGTSASDVAQQVQQNDRDRLNKELRLRSSYEYSPKLTVFLDGMIRETIYETAIDSSGIDRNNTAYEAAVGANLEFSPLLRGELRVGKYFGEYDDSQLPDFKTALFDANLVWTPTRLTTIRGTLATGVELSTVPGVSATMTRTTGINLRHALYRHMNVEAELMWQHQWQEGGDIVDNSLTSTLSAEYFVRRHVAVTARLRHIDYLADQPGEDYEVHEIRVGVRVQN